MQKNSDEEFFFSASLLALRDRVDKVSITLFCVVLFFAGMLTLTGIAPFPKSLDESLQPYAHLSWSMLLIFGAPFTLVGRLKNALEMEIAGCLALSMAFLTYCVAIAGNNLPSGLAVAVVFGALCVKYGYRSYSLSKVVRELKREPR